jgi:SAM-dependent methyltransferase
MLEMPIIVLGSLFGNKSIMPLVFQRFSADSSKIMRVVGDFNRLELNDACLGGILEVEAFHHSENLAATLSECHRVLRPGGLLILIDRAHPDHMSEEGLQGLLAKEYGSEFLARYSLRPGGEQITREWWGEHEYRIKDWLESCAAVGFDPSVISSMYTGYRIVDGLLRRIPGSMKVSLLLAALRWRWGRRRLAALVPRTASTTLFVCVKP